MPSTSGLRKEKKSNVAVVLKIKGKRFIRNPGGGPTLLLHVFLGYDESPAARGGKESGWGRRFK